MERFRSHLAIACDGLFAQCADAQDGRFGRVEHRRKGVHAEDAQI